MLSAAVKPLRRLAPSAVAMTASHMPAAVAAGSGSQGYAFGAAAAAAAAAMMAGGSLAWCLEDHSDMVIFSGTANLPLAQEVAEKLGKPLAAASVKRFADGEVSIRVRRGEMRVFCRFTWKRPRASTAWRERPRAPGVHRAAYVPRCEQASHGAAAAHQHRPSLQCGQDYRCDSLRACCRCARSSPPPPA